MSSRITPGGRCATRCRKPTRWTARRCCGAPRTPSAERRAPNVERHDMGRTWAIIERELRRFRRSPVLIGMSMTMPIVQLVVLGYAFGGNVKHLKIAVVDQDHGVPAVKVRELVSAAASGARTLDVLDYADSGGAITDLRNGRVNGVLT